MKDCADEKLGITEFADMVYISRQYIIKSPYHNKNKKSYQYHKKKITNICHTRRNYKSELDLTIYYITNLDSTV